MILSENCTPCFSEAPSGWDSFLELLYPCKPLISPSSRQPLLAVRDSPGFWKWEPMTSTVGFDSACAGMARVMPETFCPMLLAWLEAHFISLNVIFFFLNFF